MKLNWQLGQQHNIWNGNRW